MILCKGLGSVVENLFPETDPQRYLCFRDMVWALLDIHDLDKELFETFTVSVDQSVHASVLVGDKVDRGVRLEMLNRCPSSFYLMSLPLNF